MVTLILARASLPFHDFERENPADLLFPCEKIVGSTAGTDSIPGNDRDA
jgi:hypothetical protein